MLNKMVTPANYKASIFPFFRFHLHQEITSRVKLSGKVVPLLVVITTMIIPVASLSVDNRRIFKSSLFFYIFHLKIKQQKLKRLQGLNKICSNSIYYTYTLLICEVIFFLLLNSYCIKFKGGKLKW